MAEKGYDIAEKVERIKLCIISVGHLGLLGCFISILLYNIQMVPFCTRKEKGHAYPFSMNTGLFIEICEIVFLFCTSIVAGLLY